ncbi:MAG: class I SAM-dependent methyltransferase [bacterium]
MTQAVSKFSPQRPRTDVRQAVTGRELQAGLAARYRLRRASGDFFTSLFTGLDDLRARGTEITEIVTTSLRQVPLDRPITPEEIEACLVDTSVDLGRLAFGVTQQELWDWVYAEGGGLEPKIGGPVTSAHRRDFLDAMAAPVLDALAVGPVVMQEDAAGETPLSLILQDVLADQDADVVKQNLVIQIRDFSESAIRKLKAKLEKIMLAAKNVTVEQGNMFVRGRGDDESVDFIVASMAFYCTREEFRSALAEWSRLAKPGAKGWFSMKAADGDLGVVIKETIKGQMLSLSPWKKTLIPYHFFKMIFQRKSAQAFPYGRRLREGFATGEYYAPTESDLNEDLEFAGLQLDQLQLSLANQFFLAAWIKPE